MGTKLTLLAGLAAGYVLGTRAGRERYEQIRQAADAFMGSRTAQTLESGLRDAWDTAQQEFPAAASVSEKLDRDRR